MADEPRQPAGASAPPDHHSAGARSARARDKRELLVQLLENGIVMVRVDARRSGVQVPRQFSEESGLPLNLSWAFRDARMALNERGVAATLTFGGVPFRCLLPWSAIWGIRVAKGGSLQIWETDLPVELGGTEPPPLVDEMPVEPRPRLVKLPSAEEAAAATPSSSEAAVAPAPSLSVAPPDAPTAAEAPAAQPPPAAPSVSRPPWLRLVR